MKTKKYEIQQNHDLSNKNITNENEGLNKVNLISKEILESQEFRIIKSNQWKRCPSSEVLLDEGKSIQLADSISNDDKNKSQTKNDKLEKQKEKFQLFEDFMSLPMTKFIHHQNEKKNLWKNVSMYHKSKFSTNNVNIQ